MIFFKKALSKYFYKSTFFWLLFLTSLYTLIGFFLLPILIKNTIIEQVKTKVNYQTTIEKVAVNPYSLTLDIEKLNIRDPQQKTIFSFDHYHINLEIISLVKGAIHVAEVTLVTPSLNVKIDHNGVSNIQQAFSAQQTDKPESDRKNAQSNPLAKLFFQQISVHNGSVTLLDERPPTPILHQLHPINFTLTNFSTYVQEHGQYSLDVNLGQQQKLSWQGTLALAPFRSQGQLKITDLDVTTLQGYFSQFNPYNIQHALLSIDGQYNFSLANSNTDFSVSNTTITLDKVAMSITEDDQNFVNINQILVDSLNFDLIKNNVQIGSVTIQDSNLAVLRNNQGDIDLLAAVKSMTTPDNNNAHNNVNNATSTSNEAEFSWFIKQFALTNASLNFQDQQLKVPANLTAQNLNFTLNNLSQDYTQALPFSLDYSLQSSGATTFTGEVTLAPFQLTGDVNLQHIDLTMLQPYVNEQTKVELSQGNLSLQGSLKIALNEHANLIGGITGELSINNLNINDPLLQQKVVGWQQLAIQPFSINFQPLTIAINKVSLVKPYTRLIITEERTINLTNLLRQPPTRKPTPQQKISTTPLNINIKQVSFEQGGAFFADLSLTPQFGTSIQNINGIISGLSSDNLERATVDLQGTVDKYGKMSVKGKVNPLSGDLYTDINARFDKIELTTLTPYSGRYAGFVIDKGKMTLELNYKIANNQLVGNNRLILDHLELGSPVNSDEAISLPLKLALALFKDSKGIIDISLPTSGDINDPDFAFGGLVGKALMNIISKAVLSPFSMLANLAGGDVEQLSTVSFDLGSSLLSSAEFVSLDKLAEILKSRPLLILEIRANVDAINDSNKIKELKIAQQLKQLMPENASQQQHIVAMENLLTNKVSAEKVQQLQAVYQANIATTVTENEQAEKSVSADSALANYQHSLQNALLASETVSSLALTTLAKARINNIKNYLVEHQQVPHEQVFALQPSMTGKAENDRIITTFTLGNH